MLTLLNEGKLPIASLLKAGPGVKTSSAFLCLGKPGLTSISERQLCRVEYPGLAGLLFIGYFEYITPLSQVRVSVENLLVSLRQLLYKSLFASGF